MDFEDVAIVFSQEEWGLLNETQRLLHCDVTLEVFALVSSVGCWHKMDDEVSPEKSISVQEESQVRASKTAPVIQRTLLCSWHKTHEVEACSEQSVSVQGDSQVNASKTASATQRTRLCGRCFSVFKDILHLTESQAADSEQKDFFRDAFMRNFCFSANSSHEASDACGKNPWKEAVDRALFVNNFSFSGLPSSSREVGENFPAISELLQHQSPLNTEEPHIRSEISVEFLNRKSHYQWDEYERAPDHIQNLVQHQGVYPGEVKYECNICGKVFTCNFNLNRHRRVHTGEKSYQCADCGKSFNQRSHLTKHHRVHTGEKPCKCSECGKSFRCNYDLFIHKRVHTGEKPHQCSDCSKCFSQLSILIEHHRVHTGEKPYECSECGKSFRQKSQLIIHQRVHTGKKPYECSNCRKSFSNRSILTVHQRVHTGEKPYKCSECEKSFSNKSALNVHQRMHTGEKPYECSDCGKSFSTSSTLIRHHRVHIRKTL